MTFDYTSALRVESRFYKGRNLKTYIFRCSVAGCDNELRLEKGKTRRTTKCAMCASRKRPFLHTHTFLRLHAKHRNLPFSFSYEEFLAFTAQSACHYCEAPIPWQPFSKKSGYSKAYFLDRKRPELGYIRDNCVVCCTRCNFIRQAHFSYDEFCILAPALKQVRLTREGRTDRADIDSV